MLEKKRLGQRFNGEASVFLMIYHPFPLILIFLLLNPYILNYHQYSF